MQGGMIFLVSGPTWARFCARSARCTDCVRRPEGEHVEVPRPGAIVLVCYDMLGHRFLQFAFIASDTPGTRLQP